MGGSFIVGAEEFLAVRHSVLNGNTYDVGQLVEDTLNLERYTHGRRIVPCFEGDVIPVKETKETVFTHKNFLPLSRQKYQKLREKKLAASLEEVLDKVARYKQQSPGQRIVLCLEPKPITDRSTIDNVVQTLKEYKLPDVDVYFDSFFGDKLDAVENANRQFGTAYARSLHLIGNAGRLKLMMTQPKQGYEILTVPHAMSAGKLGEPVIYGAVGSVEILQKVAENPQVQGAYVRLKEGAGVKGALVKLWNSVTNTDKRGN
ncbi:MAG: hypothetical protein AB1668_01410 [Nanoarchaeota archaeon]